MFQNTYAHHTTMRLKQLCKFALMKTAVHEIFFIYPKILGMNTDSNVHRHIMQTVCLFHLVSAFQHPFLQVAVDSTC